MIKSRRDERYFGSSFEKRDPRLDNSRNSAATYRTVGHVDNDGVMSPEEYDRATDDAYRTYVQANEGDREGTNGFREDDDRLRVHNALDPDQLEAVGGTRSDTRNVGIPKKQPTMDEIPGKAQQYADRLAHNWHGVNCSDLDKNRQALLDEGYTEDDLRKFEEIYYILHDTNRQAVYNAQDNAERINNMRQGWEPD